MQAGKIHKLIGKVKKEIETLRRMGQYVRADQLQNKLKLLKKKAKS